MLMLISSCLIQVLTAIDIDTYAVTLRGPLFAALCRRYFPWPQKADGRRNCTDVEPLLLEGIRRLGVVTIYPWLTASRWETWVCVSATSLTPYTYRPPCLFYVDTMRNYMLHRRFAARYAPGLPRPFENNTHISGK